MAEKRNIWLDAFLLAQFCVAKPVACRWAIKRTRKKRRSFLLHTFLPLQHAGVRTTKPVGDHNKKSLKALCFQGFFLFLESAAPYLDPLYFCQPRMEPPWFGGSFRFWWWRGDIRPFRAVLFAAACLQRSHRVREQRKANSAGAVLLTVRRAVCFAYCGIMPAEVCSGSCLIYAAMTLRRNVTLWLRMQSLSLRWWYVFSLV